MTSHMPAPSCDQKQHSKELLQPIMQLNAAAAVEEKRGHIAVDGRESAVSNKASCSDESSDFSCSAVQFGAEVNVFKIPISSLRLSRFYMSDGLSKPFSVSSGPPTVEAKEFLNILPRAIEREIQFSLRALSSGQMYCSVSAPIGIPEPRPGVLIHLGMKKLPVIRNKLSNELVLYDRQRQAYEGPRKEFLLWRRWTELHPCPVVFCGDIDENTGTPRVVITHTPPKSLAALLHSKPQYMPFFLPSVLDDHFFLLALSAALAADPTILERAFASLEYIHRGLLVIRLLRNIEVDLSDHLSRKAVPVDPPPRVKGVRQRQGKGGALPGQRKVSMAAGSKDEDANAPPQSSIVVQIPHYLVIDTVVPVSQSDEDTIAPADIDLALGRTFDALDEFWVALLEKAYATLCGTYAALHGGSATTVLRALTMGDVSYVRWNDGLFVRSEEELAEEASAPLYDPAVEQAEAVDQQGEGEITAQGIVKVLSQDGDEQKLTEASEMAAEAARRTRGGLKVMDDVWFFLEQSVLNQQPTLLTNTALCRDPANESECSYGRIPNPVEGYEVELDRVSDFNWSFGVAVLSVFEVDLLSAIEDPYLRASRSRTLQKMNLPLTERIVKVRSAYRTLHPDYARLRGRWSLPAGGGRDDDFATREVETKRVARFRASENINPQLLTTGRQKTEESERIRACGGNELWSPFVQNLVQYDVLDVVEHQSEDGIWWMTLEEVCRNFNCMATIANCSGSSVVIPDSIFVAAATARARELSLIRRQTRDVFRPGQRETTAEGTEGAASVEAGAAPEGISADVSHGTASEASTELLTQPPDALIELLVRSREENTTQSVSDTIVISSILRESPGLTYAAPNFLHVLVNVRKVKIFNADESNSDAPEGVDIRFRTIFDVHPPSLDIAAQDVSDEDESGGGSGAGAEDGGVTDDFLGVRISVVLPRYFVERHDFTIQVYRVSEPTKQKCIKTVKDGRPLMIFPAHSRVNARVFPPTIVSASTAPPPAARNGGTVLEKADVPIAPAGTEIGTAKSKCWEIECDLNEGFYNAVITPDPETTASENMVVHENTPVEVKIEKIHNEAKYTLSAEELPYSDNY